MSGNVKQGEWLLFALSCYAPLSNIIDTEPFRSNNAIYKSNSVRDINVSNVDLEHLRQGH